MENPIPIRFFSIQNPSSWPGANLLITDLGIFESATTGGRIDPTLRITRGVQLILSSSCREAPTVNHDRLTPAILSYGAGMARIIWKHVLKWSETFLTNIINRCCSDWNKKKKQSSNPEKVTTTHSFHKKLFTRIATMDIHNITHRMITIEWKERNVIRAVWKLPQSTLSSFTHCGINENSCILVFTVNQSRGCKHFRHTE